MSGGVRFFKQTDSAEDSKYNTVAGFFKINKIIKIYEYLVDSFGCLFTPKGPS